ncbi:MAG: putative hydrolases or acyltransferases (alpha/beta hydrolase superfamily) [Bacteroidetes bacterium HLUCCA01]|nr:MAG: putative hydrolases or acyltransferases (alpha/beta hydrolase superfamily) [Bacteroidetes bacterium HLUCCA01]
MKVLRNTLLFLLGIGLMFLMTIASLMRPDIPLDRLLETYTDETSAFLEVDGMRVHYRDEGEGPAVLLIHGTFASLHTWDGWTQAMRDSFRVVRLDLPGFGLTGPQPDNDYSTRASLHVLETLRKELGIERWSLAGNSLGARIALDYARYYPEQTERLILLNAAVGRLPEPDTTASTSVRADTPAPATPAPGGAENEAPDDGRLFSNAPAAQQQTNTNAPAAQQPDESSAPAASDTVQTITRAQNDTPPPGLRLINHPRTRNLLTVLTPRAVIQLTLKEVYATEELVDPDIVQRYFELLRREGNRAAFLTRNEGATGDRSHLPALPENPRPVTRMELPVLIMWGEADTWIRVELGRALHERMPGSEFITYPDAGHVPMEEIPGPTAADAIEFLSRPAGLPVPQ